MKLITLKLTGIATLLALFPLVASSSILTDNTATATAVEKVKPYTLKTCIVSGEDLGSMDDLIRFVHGDQEIKVCCKPCVKKFRKNPKKYLKLLERKTKK